MGPKDGILGHMQGCKHRSHVWLQQMTEAAVARERAKLYNELKQKIDDQVLAANADELASLRDRQAMTNPYCFFLYQFIPNWLYVLMNAVRSITGMYVTLQIVCRIQGLQLQLEAASQAGPAQHPEGDAAPARTVPDGDAQDSAVTDLRAQLALLQRQLKATQVHVGHCHQVCCSSERDTVHTYLTHCAPCCIQVAEHAWLTGLCVSLVHVNLCMCKQDTAPCLLYLILIFSRIRCRLRRWRAPLAPQKRWAPGRQAARTA